MEGAASWLIMWIFLIMAEDNTKNNWNKITVILNQKLLYVWND